jgi:hypothetical protein
MESTSSTHGRTQPSSRQKLYTDSGEYKRITEGRVVRLYFLGGGLGCIFPSHQQQSPLYSSKSGPGSSVNETIITLQRPLFSLFFDYLFSPEKKVLPGEKRIESPFLICLLFQRLVTV